MIDIEPLTSKQIKGSPTPFAVDTFNVIDRPQGVVLKLRYPRVQPGYRVLYSVQNREGMRLSDDFYDIDLERGRITLNWDFDQDCTFIVEYPYEPG